MPNLAYTRGCQLDGLMHGSRMYHSTAVLLPSGRIVAAGSDIRTEYAPGPFADWEVYVPRNLTGGFAMAFLVSTSGATSRAKWVFLP